MTYNASHLLASLARQDDAISLLCLSGYSLHMCMTALTDKTPHNNVSLHVLLLLSQPAPWFPWPQDITCMAGIQVTMFCSTWHYV